MSSEKVIVLITGANSGVGYAAAKIIATSPASSFHVILAGRSLEKLDAAYRDLLNEPGIKGTLSTLLLDVTDDSSINMAAKQIEEQFGRVDVLLNNAGLASQDDSLRRQIQDNVDVNVAGPAVIAETFHSLLLESKNAYSIFVSSGLGSMSRATDLSSAHRATDWISYRISKAALNMLVVQEHKHKDKQGIKVFALCPGLVTSNLRGTSEEQRSARGNATDPDVAGQTILSVILGKRDADVGQFVHKDGIYPW